MASSKKYMETLATTATGTTVTVTKARPRGATAAIMVTAGTSAVLEPEPTISGQNLTVLSTAGSTASTVTVIYEGF